MNTLCENPLIWNFDDEQKKEKKRKKDESETTQRSLDLCWIVQPILTATR